MNEIIAGEEFDVWDLKLYDQYMDSDGDWVWSSAQLGHFCRTADFEQQILRAQMLVNVPYTHVGGCTWKHMLSLLAVQHLLSAPGPGHCMLHF